MGTRNTFAGLGLLSFIVCSSAYAEAPPCPSDFPYQACGSSMKIINTYKNPSIMRVWEVKFRHNSGRVMTDSETAGPGQTINVRFCSNYSGRLRTVNGWLDIIDPDGVKRTVNYASSTANH